jgi:hypothetical protein
MVYVQIVVLRLNMFHFRSQFNCTQSLHLQCHFLCPVALCCNILHYNTSNLLYHKVCPTDSNSLPTFRPSISPQSAGHNKCTTTAALDTFSTQPASYCACVCGILLYSWQLPRWRRGEFLRLYVHSFTVCEVLVAHSGVVDWVTSDGSTDLISFILKGQELMYSLSLRHTALQYLQRHKGHKYTRHIRDITFIYPYNKVHICYRKDNLLCSDGNEMRKMSEIYGEKIFHNE